MNLVQPMPLTMKAYHLGLTGHCEGDLTLHELKRFAASPSERLLICEHWRIGRLAALDAENEPPDGPRRKSIEGMRFKPSPGPVR